MFNSSKKNKQRDASKIRPEIKRLLSPDISDLPTYTPSNPEIFTFLLQMIAGPKEGEGEESLNIVVCTPGWLKANVKSPLIGRHYLIVNGYDYNALKHFLENYTASCEGKNWEEVATKLGRLGMWEFEDYHEKPFR